MFQPVGPAPWQQPIVPQGQSPGLGGFPMAQQQQGPAFLSNPLIMGGLMGVASALGGQGSAPGMALGFNMAQQRNDNAWSRQMQALQMQKLQRDMQRQDEQEARLAALTGNPQLAKMGIDPDLWAALPTAGKVKVATELLTATPKAPTTYQDQLGATRYLTGPNAGGLVPGETAQAPDEPEAWRQKFQLWQSENPGGSYTDYLAATKTPLFGSLWGDPEGTGGGPGVPAPGQVYTSEQVAAMNLDPGKTYMTDPKTMMPKVISGAGAKELSGEASRQAAMAKSGLADVQVALDTFAPLNPGTGKREFSKAAWVQSNLPLTEERDARKALERSLGNQLRLKTGAAQTEVETMIEEGQYLPSVLDTDEGAIRKMERIQLFLQDTRENITREEARKLLTDPGAGKGPLKQPPPGAVITEEDL